MTFEDFIGFILSSEGGYVDDPTDRGGETNYGISKKAYPHLDIPNLTKEKATEIYKRDYYIKSKSDLIGDLAYIHTDTAINMGVKTANKILQRSLGVSDDGIIGPITLATANDKGNVFKYALYRAFYYDKIVIARPSQTKFLRGWGNRIKKVIEHYEEII